MKKKRKHCSSHVKKQKQRRSRLLTNLIFLPASLISHIILPYLFFWDNSVEDENKVERKKIRKILTCFGFLTCEQNQIIENYLNYIYKWDFPISSSLKCRYCKNPKLLKHTSMNFCCQKNQDLAFQTFNVFFNFASIQDSSVLFMLRSFYHGPIEEIEVYISYIWHLYFYTCQIKPLLDIYLRTHLWDFTILSCFEFICYEVNFRIVVSWEHIFRFLCSFLKKCPGQRTFNGVINMINMGKRECLPRGLKQLI